MEVLHGRLSNPLRCLRKPERYTAVVLLKVCLLSKMEDPQGLIGKNLFYWRTTWLELLDQPILYFHLLQEHFLRTLGGIKLIITVLKILYGEEEPGVGL